MNDGNNFTDVAGSQMKLITPEELADWLKIPLSWIYDRTRKSGPERLPVYRIGRYLRFSIPEIEDYLRVRSTPVAIFTAEDVRDRESEFVRV